MMAADPHAESKAKAEARLWEYMEGQLAQRGQADSAGYLKHFLKAQAGEPIMRGDLTRVPFDMYHRVSDYTSKLDATDGSLMGWHFQVLADDPGDSVPAAEALKAAEAEANPPHGAVLKVSDYDRDADAPFFVARWEHEENGIPVERDYIHVLVNGKSGRPFAMYRKWHTVDFKPKER
jgi:hypothetical protein